MKSITYQKTLKQTFIAGSVALTVLANSANALEMNPFGTLGVTGNFAFGDNTIHAGDNISGYLGVTGHLGVEFDFSGFKLGVGAMAGFAPLTLGTTGGYGSNIFVHNRGLYRSPFVDASDLYIGYTSSELRFLMGRYNGSKVLSTADWIGGYNQGVAFSYQSEFFGVWATWVNDFLRNGYNAHANLAIDGRYGMDLAGFAGYGSSWHNFNLNNELFAAGVDFRLGEILSISPFAQYWLRNGADYLQAGARLALTFDLGAIKTTTTFRGLWTNNIDTGGNGVLWQADEELLLFDMIKLGGGYLSVGGIGLNGLTLVDRTRFYGQYLFPYGYNGTGLRNRGYLNATAETWYVFTGLKLGESANLDVLYANGNYKEFSAIINYDIIGGDAGEEGESGGGLVWSVGGGYVTDDFKSHTALAYTKIKF
ncbi:hypothetical protein CQA66_04085 [Helicobacter aurati]|uniref:Outer membrane family protein n=1 Tax=Helicobacter aurati TaxID=137778 RepID=A0A3D8J6Q7_9HELI|nr:hypothetical protein [Helicobacter aurati]RDU72501.1 hypothetical protein CQA66_04085 [Helicobacter aurati]